MSRWCSYRTLTLLWSFVLMTMMSGRTCATDKDGDLVVATQEMQRANYFTYVMLINMAPAADLFRAKNVTFLMPNDPTLAKATAFREADQNAADFLLRHSIPSTLLFDHILRLPTNSIIPTSNPNFMLKVSNDGRRRFFLSNVRIISPNICTASSSIRCHGIDGVLAVDHDHDHDSSTSLNCSTNEKLTPPPAAVATASAPAPLPLPSPLPTTRDLDDHKSGVGVGVGALSHRPRISIQFALMSMILLLSCVYP